MKRRFWKGERQAAKSDASQRSAEPGSEAPRPGERSWLKIEQNDITSGDVDL